MSKTCGHKNECTCTNPFTTLNCEPLTLCDNPDPCSETFCAECLVYCGETIVDLGIEKGERMDVILQRLTLFLTNPDCITPVLTGSVTNLFIASGGLGYDEGVYIG